MISPERYEGMIGDLVVEFFFVVSKSPIGRLRIMESPRKAGWGD
jgi:hypothetical protein